MPGTELKPGRPLTEPPAEGSRRARDYFDAPGAHEAAAAVASCEESLARFEGEALSAELDEATPDSRPGLRAVEGPND